MCSPATVKVVLIQELQRYNAVLGKIRKSLVNVQKGIKGLVVMSSELDEIYQRMLNGLVPPSWLQAYPSLKPLPLWYADLLRRLDFMQGWIDNGQ